jgi:hypothetical protein
LFFYDILIYSKTWAEHLRHILDFVARLQREQEVHPATLALRDEITGGARGAPWSLVDGMV